MQKTIENQTVKVEVRSSINDNVVKTFEVEKNDSVNVITAGYAKICQAFGINRVQAESRYYVTNA